MGLWISAVIKQTGNKAYEIFMWRWPLRAPVRTGTFHDVWREKEHQKIVRGEWWKKEEKWWKQGWEITQMETWRGRQLKVHCWRRRADSIEKNNITCLENISNEEEAVREREKERYRVTGRRRMQKISWTWKKEMCATTWVVQKGNRKQNVERESIKKKGANVDLNAQNRNGRHSMW